MKRIFSTGMLLLFMNALLAQEGIVFEHGSWKDVLAKAKEQNKLVFIDVYTSWCGPCKKMVAEVFPQKEVGALFNKGFINYKIDAEKGEGVEIAKKFQVKAYPTYLFVNGDGELVYRALGYNEPKKFMQEASIALKEQNDPKPFAIWQDEYNAGKRDKTFMIGYLKKRAILKMASAQVIEEAFPLLTAADLDNKELVSSIMYYDPNIAYVPKGKWYAYHIANHAKIDDLLGKKNNYSLNLLQMGMQRYLTTDIIANKQENMLPVMVAANNELMALLKKEGAVTSAKKIVMDYYNGTHDEKKLLPAAIDYVNNGLLKEDIAGMIKADAADYRQFREPYVQGKEDSTKVESWELSNRIRAKNRMINISYSLRSAAEAVYNNTNDKKMLLQAADWAKKAEEYFAHFSNEAVYAGLLLKAGKKEEAVAIMHKAIADPILSTNPDMSKLLLANLEAIKKGQAPAKLWRL